MAGKNGVHADPTGVIGRIGQAVTLGERTFTLKMLKNRDLKASLAIIAGINVAPDEETIGGQYAAGVAEADHWEELSTWLNCHLEPAITVDDLLDATPEELIAFLDVVFEQSGLAWTRRALGNRIKLMREVGTDEMIRRIARMQPLPLPSPANGSTPSTGSSLTAPESQPEPASATPATS